MYLAVRFFFRFRRGTYRQGHRVQLGTPSCDPQGKGKRKYVFCFFHFLRGNRKSRTCRAEPLLGTCTTRKTEYIAHRLAGLGLTMYPPARPQQI